MMNYATLKSVLVAAVGIFTLAVGAAVECRWLCPGRRR